MSLVNEMLNDLEKRRKKDGQSGELPEALKPTDTITEPSKRFPWLWLVLAIVVLVLIVLGLWWWSTEKASRDSVVSSSVKTHPAVAQLPRTTQAKVTPQSENATQKAKAFGSIYAVDLKQQGDVLNVYFPLSQPLRYEVSASKDHKQVMLTVHKGTFTGDLPDYSHTLINAFTEKQLKDHLVFTLGVQPGTVIHGLQLVHKPKLAIVLSLKEAATPPPPPTPEPEQDNVKKQVLVKTPAQIAAEQYNKALDALNAGHVIQASSLLGDILKDRPTDVPARQTMAILLVNNGESGAAVKLLNQGLKLSPQNAPLTVTLAQILLQKGELKASKAVLQNISPDINKYPQYYELAAALDQRLGEYDYAGQYYQQLLRLNSSQGKYWLGLGVALESSGKPNAAAKAYREAIATKNLNANMQVFAESRLNELGGL